MSLKRKPVDMPRPVAKLLQGAGLGDVVPEVAMGQMFGALAYLLVSVWEQWPEAWPTFRQAGAHSIAELRQLINSGNPRVALEAIIETQKLAGRQTLERAQAADAR